MHPRPLQILACTLLCAVFVGACSHETPRPQTPARDRQRTTARLDSLFRITDRLHAAGLHDSALHVIDAAAPFVDAGDSLGTAVEVLLMQPGNPRMVHVIRDSCRQIDALVGSATTLSHVMADEHIPLADLAVDDLLGLLEAEYASALAAAGMRLERDVPPGCRIHAHPIISEVFRNFTENAMRHAAPGSSPASPPATASASSFPTPEHAADPVKIFVDYRIKSS